MATAMKHKQRSKRSHHNKQTLKDHALASFAKFNFSRSFAKKQQSIRQSFFNMFKQKKGQGEKE